MPEKDSRRGKKYQKMTSLNTYSDENNSDENNDDLTNYNDDNITAIKGSKTRDSEAVKGGRAQEEREG